MHRSSQTETFFLKKTSQCESIILKMPNEDALKVAIAANNIKTSNFDMLKMQLVRKQMFLIDPLSLWSHRHPASHLLKGERSQSVPLGWVSGCGRHKSLTHFLNPGSVTSHPSPIPTRFCFFHLNWKAWISNQSATVLCLLVRQG